MKVDWCKAEVPADNEEFYKSAIETMLPAMSIDILWIIWRQACRFLDDNRQPLVKEDMKQIQPAGNNKSAFGPISDSLEDLIKLSVMIDILGNAAGNQDNLIDSETLSYYCILITERVNKIRESIDEALDLIR